MDTVSGELAVLDQASEALHSGNSGGALRHLGEYSRSFPTGKLRLEAEALRIEALAASGNRAEASRRAKRFLEHNPNSVLAPRLRKFVVD
jgi:outer membrane protein assembly factor BamD (BamD/ComL family)